MKIKVATTFSLRSDSRDGQNSERFVSSALSIDPDDPNDYSEEQCVCGSENEVDANTCPERSACMKSDKEGSKPLENTKHIPRFMIIGKPGTGKSSLAEQLCEQFGCTLVNATSLIEHNLATPTTDGMVISDVLKSGCDLDDTIILELLKQKLLSQECKQNGYVIDGIPTESEHTLSIEQQLETIFSMENGPEYIIDIKIPSEDLKDRLKDAELEYHTAQVYSKETFASADSERCLQSPENEEIDHPEFPDISGSSKELALLNKHEGYSKQMSEQVAFYDKNIDGQVNEFIAKRDPNAVIDVDGRASSMERLKETLSKLKEVPTSDVGQNAPSVVDSALLQSLVDAKRVFNNESPRVILVGKPCTGKTTLGRLLSKAWGSRYLNVDDLIAKHIDEASQRGREVRATLERGEEVPEAVVFSILNEELDHESTTAEGFVLDGMPNYSSRPNSVQLQLDFMVNIRPAPKYWIVLEMEDNDLIAQYGKVPIESYASRLSSLPSEDLSDSNPSSYSAKFPTLSYQNGMIMLSKHEELADNMEKRFYFYNQYVAEPLELVLRSLPSNSVIRLKRPQGVAETLRETILSLREAGESSKPSMLRTFSSSKELLTVPPELVGTRSIWKNNIPRVVLVGKPCAGKTTLAKIMSEAWNCEYLNAFELMEQNAKNASRDQGQDQLNNIVLDMLNNKLQSPECQKNGYILEDFPDLKAHMKSAESQLRFLDKLNPGPVFWVVIEISDEDLRARWEAVGINHADGAPCSEVSHSTRVHSPSQCEFPFLDEETKRLLLNQSEDNMQKVKEQVQFYNEHVVIPLERFLERFDPSTIVYLNAVRHPEQLAKELSEIIQYRIEHWEDGVPPPPHPDTERESPNAYTIRFPKRSFTEHGVEGRLVTPKPVDVYRPFDDELGSDILTEATPGREIYNESIPSSKPMGSETLETCCCHCGSRFLEESAKLWENQVPRFLVIGKPCTGKTALAKLMCDAWQCDLVNASELIRDHMAKETSFGKRIKDLMYSGKDLDDELVINIMSEKLHSSASHWHGYVLDDFPTYSEKSLTVQRQLEFLETLNPPPDYVIHVQMPDDLLRSRWEKVKIDLRTGLLHVDQVKCAKANSRSAHNPTCCMPPSALLVKPPASDGHLITRHEELEESMDANITFFHEVVEPQLLAWVNKNFENRIITMDGDLPLLEMFQVLQRKLELALKNKDRPLDQLFTDTENSFVPGSCCKRCGIRYENLEPMPDLWENYPPRFIIFGKPCTGKTVLAKRMCNLWNCQLVNASDLVAEHLSKDTNTGQQIRSILSSGQDLPDQFVINMLSEKLLSPGCAVNGYVLDGVPTHSEKSQSIDKQMEFLENLNPRPDYVVDIRMTDKDLRSRWENVRIDVEDGALYVSEMYGQKFAHPGESKGRLVRHPDFPPVDEQTKERLITRHEELPENLDKHFPFYNAYINPQVRKFIQSHDPSKVIVLDADMSPTKMLNTLLYKLHVMALNPGVPTSGLFPEDFGTDNGDETASHCCQVHYPTAMQPLEELWLDKPPRVMILGKPCTGKTTLAKRLCAAWGCHLVNASEMTATELQTNSSLGQRIRETLVDGTDLPDDLVLDVIHSLITSPECIENGYVLDGIPTHSQLSKTIEQQLEMLRSLDNGPEYIIEIEMDDNELYNRWQDIRIDVDDGMLYTKQNYEQPPPSENKRRVRHPDFPVIDEVVKARLLTRHEELPENLKRHFDFYHGRLEGPLKQFTDSHDPAAIVRVKGNVSPTELLQSVLQRLSIMARHPGVPTAILFKQSSEDSIDSDSSSCRCQCDETKHTLSAGLWKHGPPKVLLIGNSCSGKSTLARRLAKDWDCILVNATELVLQRMAAKTTLGDHIRRIMCAGQDLPDQLVLELLRDKLESGDCIERGYILDDFPTSSEKAMSVQDQLNMLLELSCSPCFVVDIQLSEEDLRKRWESIRIDLIDGALYPERSVTDQANGELSHPQFPTPNENIRQRLITRHEEIVENIKKQTEFYNNYVRPQIDQFLAECYKDRIIRVDGMKRASQQCRVINKTIREYHQKFGAI